ncbi:MAG: TonB-dependent receptor [Candidatus Eremiobacteraeota bacterium]|nr:TonB-dependent receptor [Candidatus Eremiobacteraeota bacterium]
MSHDVARRLIGKLALLITAVSFVFFAVAVSGSNAFASSAGVLSGTVTETTTGAPLAGVQVAAVSASGSYKTTTNPRGFYAMAGVYADTYSVTFFYEGYDVHTESGVSVFADQVVTVNVKLTKSPKLLGHVVVRSQASAFQPTETTATTTISAAQVQNLQGTPFNISETNLITSLPGAMLDSSGYPVIHGGREYEEGFQFEGIPYVDAYSNQFTNSLAIPTAGVQLLQLTPGAGNASQGGGGTGTFNVVARRGTYPPYAQMAVANGGPGFDHRLNLDSSWATADGRVSNYMSFAGQGTTPRYGDGTTPVVQLNSFYSLAYEFDRELLDNFNYRFGTNNSQSLQFFIDVADHNFYEGAGGNTGLCFASCDPVFDSTWGGIYGFSTSQIQGIAGLYPGQTSQQELLSTANRYPNTFFQPNSAMKLEYTRNVSSSTYFSTKLYRQVSVVTFDHPSSAGSATGDYNILQGGQTTGFTLSLQKQVNDRNLFTFGADYNFVHPIDQYRSDSFGLFGALVSPIDITGTVYGFIPPNDPNCPLGPGGCGYAYNFPGAPAQLTYPQFDQVSTVNRQDYSLYVNDKTDFSGKFKGEFGLRLDMATYRLPTPGVDPNYCTTTYLPATWTANPSYNPGAPLGNGNCPFNATFNVTSEQTRPKILQPRIGLSYAVTPNTAIRATYDRGVAFVPIASVDFGEVDPKFYINTPYGSLPAVDLLTGGPTNCGLAPTYVVPCKSFGEQLYWASQNFDGIPYQPALPMTADNYQLTLQTQFTKGLLNGVAVSVAPWHRFQHNTSANEAAPIIGANGQPLIINGVIQFQPPVLTNQGREFATGVDFNVTHESAYGLSGQFTASYINEFTSVIPTSTLEDFYPNIIPASLLLGNIYRVGFVSPFQTTLGLTYKTHTGWRINPRVSYNIGYPTSLGLQTAALVNGVPFNLPNTNALIGSAPNGPACFVDPMNPGSLFNPNIAACRGNAEAAFPGAKLTAPNSSTSITLEYAAHHSPLTFGINVDNVFNEKFTGPLFNSRYQPVATGITGPLTGWSTSRTNYTNYPSAWPQYQDFIGGRQTFVNIPSNPGPSFYFYVQARTL